MAHVTKDISLKTFSTRYAKPIWIFQNINELEFIEDSRIHERGSMKCKSHTIKKGSDKAIKGFLTMREENVKHHVGCKMKWQRHICDGLCTSAATIFSCIAKFDESAILIWQMSFQ